MTEIRSRDANALTEAEKIICKMYLEDLDKFHTCNEYKLLMSLIDNAPTVKSIKQCKYCKHCGNEEYCSNCHSDHSLFEYYERPQGDLISREALKKEIERTFDMQDLYLPVHFLDLIDNAPTITPEKALMNKLRGKEE